jgi:AmiR/NasT family two-component response regulator
MLQEQEGMTEAEAFRTIQKQAMAERITMKQVAERVIAERS